LFARLQREVTSLKGKKIASLRTGRTTPDKMSGQCLSEDKNKVVLRTLKNKLCKKHLLGFYL
jgi:hypothetical protein